MRLAELIERFGGECIAKEGASEHVAIQGIRHDSREIRRGELFVALDGDHHRGLGFIPDAIGRGAAAVLASERVECEVPLWIVPDPEALFGPIAEAIYGEPTRSLRVFGVTGTNGKTTIAHLISESLARSGRRVATIGTGALRFEGLVESSPFTTPFGDRISRFAREALDAGATDLVMEVSSHALAQRRADGVRFDFAAFSNLTRDHLDYHETFEAYQEAKERLLFELAPRSVINIDDPAGRAIAERLGERALRVSTRDASAEIFASKLHFDQGGISAELKTPFGPFALRSPLHGAYNLENLLVALGLGILAGEGRAFAEALSEVGPAKGRLEAVDHPVGAKIYVDYAHTPDALRGAIEALRPLSSGRLIVVFGCGGDRDRGKRPEMGAIASKSADVVVLTSDNPRSEDPTRIIEEIRAGAEEGSATLYTEEDRAKAISLALGLARADDLILVAGKGHEDYQIIGDERLRFDDREVIEDALRRLP